MIAPIRNPRIAHDSSEQFLAELTVAAHRVALSYEFQRSFAEAELALWEALRDVVVRHGTAASA
ncbi:MAG: hypothetical protein K8T25_24180 [Planctomycetia bacterium]|nr:hypothetical protein [Planctomycetia bacterium]